MIERFQGETGHPHLIEAFKAQKIVAGDQALAERIVEIGTLIEVSSGTAIIEQGAEENDVFLIIAGAFDVLANGRRVNRRFSNDHIGEMAAIQPTQRRSATCLATEKSVVCKLTEPQLTDLGRRFPEVWRFIAKELARRLEQRNAHVTATHEKIRIFIISSAEGLVTLPSECVSLNRPGFEDI
jgi:CRP-like cAMP-binding protein